MRSRSIVLASLCAVLTAVGARIAIPIGAVPITLQVVVVLLSGFLLGPRLGAVSQIVYIALGLTGVPVFTSGGGIQTLLSPTFGYIVGFVPMAWCAGRLTTGNDTTLPRFFLCELVAVCVLYLFGASVLMWNMTYVAGKSISPALAFKVGILPFVGIDIVKAVIASLAAWKIRPLLFRDR